MGDTTIEWTVPEAGGAGLKTVAMAERRIKNEVGLLLGCGGR